MIFEYALEPELVTTWVDRRLGRYFLEKFGLGRPRIVSRYPKRWKRLVWEAFKSDNELERKRMEELLTRLSETMVKRQASAWDPGTSWLANAATEQDRAPFHAILARENPSRHPVILVADELEEDSDLWALPQGVAVERTAGTLAAAVSNMLRSAQVILFIDPFFAPQRDRYRRTLRAFLRACLDRRAVDHPSRIRVLSSDDSKNGEQQYFADQCRSRLPREVPRGLELTVCRLRQRESAERLHNRYILTDLGGVMFGVGLDEGEPGDTDDIQLLDRKQYEERWRQYAGADPSFDQLEPGILVTGSS